MSEEENEKKEGGIGDKEVSTIMIGDVDCFTPNMTVRECIEILLNKGISGAPLVKENTKKVVGVVGQKDLIQFAAVGGMDKALLVFINKIKKIDELIVAAKTETIKEVIIKFLKNPVRRLLVIDDKGNLEGIITRSQLLKIFLADNT